MRATLSFLLPAGALLVVSCTQGSLPQSPLLKWLERPSGRIAYIALDGNVHTTDQGGGHRQQVTTDAVVDESGGGTSFFYQFPSWSRDGKSLAFVGLHHDAQGSRDSGIWTSVDGAPPVQVYRSPDHVPRYLSWSPDSSRLVFAAGHGDDPQQLELVPARGGDVRVLDSATGFAWRWENGGARLAVHSVNTRDQADEERVRIVDSLGVAEDRQLALQPGDFQAPAWAPDGRGLILAVNDATGSTLYLADSAGAPATALAHVDGRTTLDLSPDGRRLAWAARTAGGDAASRSLYVLDLAGRLKDGGGPAPSSPSPVSGGDYVAAFSWSPDGSKIAYFVPSETDLSLTLKVLTVKSRALRTVATFIPSAYFLGMLVEFGQYAESVRLWSPDGKFLLYCEAQPDASFDVMVAYADQPIAPRKVADGLIATWSPR